MAGPKKYKTFNTTTKREELVVSVVTSGGSGNDGDLVALNSSGILSDSVLNATVTSSANKTLKLDGSGKIDSSVLPTGVGAQIIATTAGEGLTAGNLVYIFTDGTAKKADGPTGKASVGFVKDTVSSSDPVNVYVNGTNDFVTGLTTGSKYFLGTGGAATLTPDTTTTGAVIQHIGDAASATSLAFDADVLFFIG